MYFATAPFLSKDVLLCSDTTIGYLFDNSIYAHYEINFVCSKYFEFIIKTWFFDFKFLDDYNNKHNLVAKLMKDNQLSV